MDACMSNEIEIHASVMVAEPFAESFADPGHGQPCRVGRHDEAGN